MARKLSTNTINKFKKKLLAEKEQLTQILEHHQQERENIRLSEASAERSPDPTSADGGSMAFELEKELTLDDFNGISPITMTIGGTEYTFNSTNGFMLTEGHGRFVAEFKIESVGASN